MRKTIQTSGYPASFHPGIGGGSNVMYSHIALKVMSVNSLISILSAGVYVLEIPWNRGEQNMI
jgi:hypothetical protein